MAADLALAAPAAHHARHRSREGKGASAGAAASLPAPPVEAQGAGALEGGQREEKCSDGGNITAVHAEDAHKMHKACVKDAFCAGVSDCELNGVDMEDEGFWARLEAAIEGNDMSSMCNDTAWVACQYRQPYLRDVAARWQSLRQQVSTREGVLRPGL